MIRIEEILKETLDIYERNMSDMVILPPSYIKFINPKPIPIAFHVKLYRKINYYWYRLRLRLASLIMGSNIEEWMD